MSVLLTGSPISGEDFSISVRAAIGFLVSSSTKVLSLAGWPDLGRVLVVQTFFHFITSNDKAHHASGNI